jgi:hypothetical protein
MTGLRPLALFACLALAGGLRAQSDGMAGMDMGPMSGGFAGVPETRLASGTAWQPDATPMYGTHVMLDGWGVMLHYHAFLAFDDQSGPRGGHQVGSTNWAMAMASRRWGDDELSFRAMLSLEPWTVTKRGYPLLFQTGEAYNGSPLVDRQHPHDFFMELAARYRRALGRESALSLYLAPSGEPALGPPVFMHRPSALDNPASPISHHWMDSTHISFGVATLGFSRGPWQVEGSWFNGREPGENRWEIGPPHLDSYSGRISWNPSADWSAQVSTGYLRSPEELDPGVGEHRTTASLMNVRPLAAGRVLATTWAWGQKRDAGVASNALLAESDWQLSDRYTVFGRLEWVEKTGDELILGPASRKYDVTQFSLGATRELTPGGRSQLALGGEVTYSAIPDSLQIDYGRHPLGYWIFLRLRPARMNPGMAM